MLPPAAVLDLTFGEALAKEGRTKEAALRFAAAHVGAANVTDIDGALSAERIRQVVVARMASLAEVWDAGEGALTDTPVARPRPSGSSSGGSANGSGGDAPVQVVQASAEGTMKKMEMSQEEMVRISHDTSLARGRDIESCHFCVRAKLGASGPQRDGRSDARPQPQALCYVCLGPAAEMSVVR